jgi:hypothetical protein
MGVRLALRSTPDSALARCRYCRRPIRHYPHCGWLDVTSPYYGGSYDLCPGSFSSTHVPED